MQVIEHQQLNGLWRRIGALSYPLYVLHAPAALILAAVTGGRERLLAPAAGVILIIILISLADYVTRKFEKPMQTWWRDRLFHPA